MVHVTFARAVLVAVAIAEYALAGKVCTAQGLGYEMRLATSKDCNRSKTWDYAGNGHLTVNTKLPQDAKLKAGTWTSGGYTCDHIVELSMVKQVMEASGGACDQAKALNDKTKALAAIAAIAKVANAKSNLVFFDKHIEAFKGQSVQNYLGTGSFSDPLHNMNVWELGALYDYATAREGGAATSAAHAIDAAITAQFPSAHTGVTTKWAGWVAKVSARWAIEEAAANKQVKQLVQQAAQNAARTGNCGTTTSTGSTKRASTKSRFVDLADRTSLTGGSMRMTRRHLTTLDTIAPVADTAIQRRSRGAARSGPHAPAAPSCPIKGATQKKAVKRSATKQKAPRTSNPRQPAKRPATKKANPKKQVAKRPANRPRRTKGVQKKRTRVTPKKKPKVVKKPAKKARGKARRRR